MKRKILLSVLLLLVSCACVASELRLKEASSLELHGIDDYLEWVPMEALDEAGRNLVSANGKSSAQDFVSASGRYSLFHKFEGDRVFVRSLLMLLPPSESASIAYTEWNMKVEAELEKSGGTILNIPCPAKWVEECKFSRILNSAAQGIGNVFVLRNGRSIYSVTILGLSSFADAQSARDFLEEKALNAMAFRPASLATEVEKEKRKITDLPKESARQGMTLGLLILYTLVYVTLYWVVALMNRVSGRVILGRRIAAFGGTSLLAISLGLYVMRQVVNAGALKPLEPFELGLVQGELIGMYLGPLLLLALGVGLSVWRESRKSGAVSPSAP